MIGVLFLKDLHIHDVREKHLYFNTDSDNKEHKGGTIGQTKSLHGKPLPTASQFQDQSRFEERW